MEENFKYFVNNHCLICEDSDLFTSLVEQFDFEIINFKQQYSYLPKIILNESQPVRFLAGFIVACRANCPVFLCNPDWGKQEWLQVFDLVKPDIIWGTKDWNNFIQADYGNQEQIPMLNDQSSHIMIPTGGSSGKIKFAIHTWNTLTASVRGFKEYFQVDKINSFCVLPLYHVSGLMQFMRCFITGGKLVISPFKKLELCNKYNIDNLQFFISLVPTQLERLFQKSCLTEWLSKFQAILLGGAPAWDELLEKARFHHLRLAPTYGMTETASQIVTMKPDDFLRGKVGCGQILPHAKLQICNETNEVLQPNQIGNINIQAESLTLGYYPLNDNIQTHLQIDDLACLDEQGYLKIIGRNSDKIITGGENVYPAEVEATIRTTGMVDDVCVIGLDDKYWGQVVTAIYVKKLDISHLDIQILLKEKISNYKIPKVWIPVDSLPRNSQGKINRQKLYEIAMKDKIFELSRI